MSQYQPMNEFIRDQYGDDPDILEELIDSLAAVRDDYATKLEQAYQSQKPQEFAEACHEIKGVVSNLGQSSCWKLVFDCELAAKSGNLTGSWEKEQFLLEYNAMLATAREFCEKMPA